MKQKNRISMMITAIGLCIIFSVNLVSAQSWTKDEIVTNALEKTNAVSVNDSKKNNKGVIFLDVRTKNEYLAGNIPGSVHLQRGFLELKIEGVLPDKNKKIIVYCKAGIRSALAALTLMEMGYKNVYNLKGGYNAWLEADCPFSK